VKVVWLLWTRIKLKFEIVSMLRESYGIMKDQSDLLINAAQEIARWQELALISQRGTRDLAIAFRAHQDAPGIDIREDLDALVQELSDAVAQLEEHITT